MVKQFRNLTALILICFSSTLSAQNLSNKGTDFWVGFGHHQFFESGTQQFDMVLYLSAEQPAVVTVSINGTTYNQTFTIPANTVITTPPIPRIPGGNDARLYDGATSEGMFNKGIHITSNVPIVAYSHIYGLASSGATMLMPTNTWGYSYTSLNSYQNYAANCFSWTYVVAKENNTVVEITPSVPTRGGRPANVPFQVTLQQGQIYQVLGANKSGSEGWEMTGTKVRSIANSAGICHPIAVFSGSSRTTNPSAACTTGGGDNDMQQAFPFQAWGKRYLLAPMSASTSPNVFQTNIYKILVSDPTTTVSRNGVPLPNNPTGVYIINTASNAYITADKPIMVAQFMSGGSGCLNGGVGDPEMIFLSPIEQGIKRIGFYRNNEQSITVNYLTLIIPSAGLTSLTVDGQPVPGTTSLNWHTYDHPNLSGYKVVIRRWTAAPAQCIVQSDSAFTAITYGLGSVESYGYNAGTNINNLQVKGVIKNTADSLSTNTSHPYTCKTTPFELSMLVAYQPTQMQWLLSQVTGLSPNANVIVNAPISAGTVTIDGTVYYKYTLPGNYTFADTGFYTIPVKLFHPSIDNCDNSELVSFILQSKVKPATNFTFNHTGCQADSVSFTSPVPTGNGYNTAAWNWSFADGTTLSGSNVVKLFSAAGSQPISLNIVTSEGCIGDTIKNINIFTKPGTVITAAPETVCVGGSIAFSATSSYQGSAPINSYYWNFGNGTITNPTTAAPQTITYTTPGVYTVKSVVKVTNTCISDTATKIVTVYAKPSPSFIYPAGCLPSNGIVTFNNTTSVSDGQAMTYAWEFGDPNATPSNPNTSTTASPSHTYGYGNYTIKLTATTANGCVKDTTVAATFNISPVLAFSPIASACENTIGTINVANGSVTNGVSGTGTYVGPSTTAAGLFNPSQAGPGTHTIWYKYATPGGCTDSISQNITVYAAPVPTFVFPVGCLPANGIVTFNNTTTIADAQTMTYNWDFGDAASTPSNPNTSTATSPSHTYGYGTYTIKLTATSNNGCTKELTTTTTFNITPVLAFSQLPAVCQNTPGTISVANASVTNNVSGTGVYSGPGTNAAGQFSPSQAGPGTHTIWYKFTTPGACKDSISQTIVVNAAPVSSFSIPSACLPTNGQVQFTGNSTIIGGQALSYSWNFGDPNANGGNPNTSTAQNPTHNYATGTYSIVLTTTSANGCTDDTTISRTFNVTPLVTYPAISEACVNGTAVNIASASVTNGVPGTGVYSGPGTSAAGIFNPTAAGTGLHTITYIFTGGGGCADTATSTIRVNVKPVSSFAVTPNVCLGVAPTVTDNSTISSGTITSWTWNYGNGNGSTTNSGSSFTIPYTTEGSYTVKLVTQSDKGCYSDTATATAAVRPLPQASFTLPASICMPNGTGNFINTTTISDNSTLTFNWNFGDGGTSTVKNPSHTYSASTPVTVSLSVTSPFGCTAQTSQQLSAFFDKPIALFSLNPKEFCQGVPNNITNLSSAPNSTVNEWSWNFGDGTTSNQQNPPKQYTKAGTFPITLTVKNAVGCSSDPFQDSVLVRLQPVIDAGPSFVVMQGTTVTFRPVVNGQNGVTFTWSPNAGFNNANSLYPSLVVNNNATYTLTAVGLGNCTATDTLTVRILKPITIPNAFSPNGDGQNDTWVIPNLVDYPGIMVEVYNRYGQVVYQSVGYGKPWDGTYKGNPLPFATYYYIITLKNGLAPQTGTITIVK